MLRGIGAGASLRHRHHWVSLKRRQDRIRLCFGFNKGPRSRLCSILQGVSRNIQRYTCQGSIRVTNGTFQEVEGRRQVIHLLAGQEPLSGIICLRIDWVDIGPMAIVDRHTIVLHSSPLLEPLSCQLMDPDGILALQPFRSAHILVIGVVNAP